MPGKNTRLLLDKPLIVWTIEAAKRVSDISRVIVNTDDKEIADISGKCGVEIFMRPKELAEDLSDDFSVFFHHLKILKEKNDLPDMIVDLRATAPLRRAERIAEGIELLSKLGKEKVDSVRVVSVAAKHPYKMWRMDNGFLQPLFDEKYAGIKEPYNAPRQALPNIYQNNGCMNAFWPETVLEKKSVTGDKVAGYVMEDWESVNIDTELDFLAAEHLMRKHKKLYE